MEKLQVGRILRPQGIRGEVKVAADTDDAHRFLDLKQVYLGERADAVEVLSARVSGKEAYLMLAGCADRSAAEKLRGIPLLIDRCDAVPLPPDTYFVADMLGIAVVTNSGKRLGTVADILQNGAADVYVLDNGTMFPFLKDLALSVDLAARTLTVDERRFEEVAVYAD